MGTCRPHGKAVGSDLIWDFGCRCLGQRLGGRGPEAHRATKVTQRHREPPAVANVASAGVYIHVRTNAALENKDCMFGTS